MLHTTTQRPSVSGRKSRSCAFQQHTIWRARNIEQRRHRNLRVNSMLPKEAEVVIVGAGLAGLSCAVNLHKAGVTPLVLEASDGVGGRVRTDVVDGFLLDRGFQIFLTSYPEAQACLDYPALDLKPFYAGARVWWNGGFHIVADPARHLVDGLLSLANPIGSVKDKILVGWFRVKSLVGSSDEIMRAPETSTLQKLQEEGFSERIIQTFFRPFLGGIFFDRSLGTTSRLFSFVMRSLALGSNCLPANGIGEVTRQLARQVPPEVIATGCKVSRVKPDGEVELADGRVIRAASVVVAVEGPEAGRVLGSTIKAAPSSFGGGVGTCCLYFSAPTPPSPEPMLYLNGESSGLVNNCCFPSTVAPSYAPPGQTLVSASTVGIPTDMSEAQLEDAVRQQLSTWFGVAAVSSWKHLRTYRIPFAQPTQAPPTNFERPVALGGPLFVCGDHRDSATFDGALKSGRRAAEAVLARRRAGNPPSKTDVAQALSA